MTKSKKFRNKKHSRKMRNKKYKCVKLTRRNKKYRGGATPIPSSANVSLPMVIDKNNVAYSCTPIPTN
jgi:hypothetical protein